MADDRDDDTPEDVGPAAYELLGLPTRERDYIVPAADAQHQSVRVQCRVQPTYARLIADIHQSKKYPFRVQGDLIRFCIVTMVKRLAAGAGMTSTIAQADIILETLRDEEYQLQVAEVFSTVKRVIDRYLDRGATGKARELVAHIRGDIEKMTKQYWRGQYLEELERRYGSLLDGDQRTAEPGTGAFVTEDGNGED